MASQFPVSFQDCILYTSIRSPFGRRVRLALQENGIRYTEKIIDVWKPNEELLQRNLLGRVPVVLLSGGQELYDSNLILQTLYQRSAKRSLLEPESAADFLLATHWSGLAYGIIEQTVAFYLEGMREASAQDAEWITEYRGSFIRFLDELEKEIAQRATVVGGQLTQADLDIGTALAYLEFRYDPHALERHPQCRRYLRGLEARPSFERTRPTLAG